MMDRIAYWFFREEIEDTVDIEKRYNELSLETKKMLELWCPLMKGNCRGDCSFFLKGRVDGKFRMVKPKCKLWGLND